MAYWKSEKESETIYQMNQGFYSERLKELTGLSKRRLRADPIAVYKCLHVQKVSEIRVTFNSETQLGQAYYLLP